MGGIVLKDMSISPLTNTTTWAVKPCSWTDAAKISEELGIPQVVAMVLVGRGIRDTASAREFLECNAPLPDPFLFSDMDAAVQTILSAVDKGHRIVVHGDYDADGITATALMVSAMRDLGGDVDWYLPSRFKEGYGLSVSAVEGIVAEGADLLITVDCGVNYPDEVALARERGVEVIVVDHHEPGPVLPKCHVIHHSRGTYPDGELCGVGLALKVLHALHIERHGAERHSLPRELMHVLDLVAIGTVADLSALRGENRYYVKEGLRLLNLGQRVGLRALAEVSNCAGSVDSGAIAFRLAPRLNAAGRLADPTPPLRLLITDDEREAKQLAARLHELNGERQELERMMFDSAKRQVESAGSLPTVIVLADAGWHEGVVGIVASRMVELYQRPTILLSLSEGIAKGSGRSIPSYDLLAGIDACGDLLSVYGGHSQAAGLTLDAENVDAFREQLERHASSELKPEDLIPRYRADAVIASEELNPDTAKAIDMLEPFGSGNARPRFLVVDTVLQNVEPTRNGLHLRCRAKVGGVGIQGIGFGMGHRAAELKAEGSLVLGAQLKADEWQGSVRSQLIVERIASVSESEYANGWTAAESGCFSARDDAKGRMGTGSTHNQLGVDRNSGAVKWPASAHDLRDRPGRLTALAQVLATGESGVILTTSATRTLELLSARLPLRSLTGEIAVGGVGWTSGVEDLAGLEAAQILVVEWDAVSTLLEMLKGRSHVVVFDPPYRGIHIQAVSTLGEEGGEVHLLYGEAERKENVALLRYLIHPRFPMVCVHNARQSNTDEDDGQMLKVARRLGWEQARVCLTVENLERAQAILSELGLDKLQAGQAKLDARRSEIYREAEAEYEECVRSCLTL